MTIENNNTPQKIKKPNRNIGHRQRMRKKFLLSNKSVLDYELLEMLLFYVFKQSDTKQMAKLLLENFKTLRSVCFADVYDLKKIDGIGDSTIFFLKIIKELFDRFSLDAIKDTQIVASSDHVINYYKNILEGEKKEQLRIMFLNNKNKLIADEIMQEGTVNHTQIYPREIVQKALGYGASAIVMVHNHPSGDPQPSRQDIVITKFTRDLLEKLDIHLLDHVIIGKNSTKSMKSLGIL